MNEKMFYFRVVHILGIQERDGREMSLMVSCCKLLGAWHSSLTYVENITIFKHAFKYIKDSKRFTIV